MPDVDQIEADQIEADQVDPAALLRRHGVQLTAQRLAVFRAVAGRPHGTADEIEEMVRGQIGTVSRQAIYDALGVLTDKGIIRRIQPARSPARYEDRVDDNHHHLVCRTCGVTVDVPCAVGATPCLEAADDHGFLIDEAEVIYWGTCPECQMASPIAIGAGDGSEPDETAPPRPASPPPASPRSREDRP